MTLKIFLKKVPEYIRAYTLATGTANTDAV
jgi:hypothetical protein